MRGSWRWAVVGGLVALLVALPLVVRVLPVPPASGSPDADAVRLLDRVRASSSRPYSGHTETIGTLTLPATDQLDAVTSLLGGRTEMRVWWRSAQDWRADTVTPVGEHSTRVSGGGVQVWDYEDNTVVAQRSDPPGTIRLPQAFDTLPPQLASRMLADAAPTEVAVLAPRRVAGRDADGLRLQPDQPLSSVGRVDVWADRQSGVPVSVEVFARGATTAAMSSTFLAFADQAPAPEHTRLDPPPGARIRSGQRPDLPRQIGRTSAVTPPARLLGYARTAPAPGYPGVGQYGRGVTQVAVGVLPDGPARSLREQLQLAGNARIVPGGLTVSVGPVGLLLTTPTGSGPTWLVAGTLTSEGLSAAAAELTAGSSS